MTIRVFLLLVLSFWPRQWWRFAQLEILVPMLPATMRPPAGFCNFAWSVAHDVRRECLRICILRLVSCAAHCVPHSGLVWLLTEHSFPDARWHHLRPLHLSGGTPSYLQIHRVTSCRVWDGDSSDVQRVMVWLCYDHLRPHLDVDRPTSAFHSHW